MTETKQEIQRARARYHWCLQDLRRELETCLRESAASGEKENKIHRKLLNRINRSLC